MNKRGSLFTRLLLTFFIAGVMVIVSLVSSYHFLANKPHRGHVRANLRAYAELIIEQQRNPVKLQRILDRTGLEFHKIEPAREDQFERKNFPKHRFRKGKKFSISKRKHPIVLKIKKRDYIYYLNPDKKHLDRWGGWIPFLVGIGFSLLILIITYHFVQRLLRPIRQIEEGAKRYGQGDLDQNIPVEGNNELTSLTESINQMRNNIKLMLESKSELLLVIAHELKTPLARMRLNAELLEDEKRQSSLIEEVDEMNHIIDSLLESERLGRNQTLHLTETNLNDFLKSFKQERVDVISNEEDIHYSLDPLRMKLAIKNLLANSLKYSEGQVTLSLVKTESLEIIVQDSGAGIPEEELTKITDAFYRPDSARNRKTGGVGLGLYLVKQIVQAHGGKLVLENDQGLKARIILSAK